MCPTDLTEFPACICPPGTRYTGFDCNAPIPVIDSVNPAVAVGGNLVIKGYDFADVMEVYLGDFDTGKHYYNLQSTPDSEGRRTVFVPVESGFADQLVNMRVMSNGIVSANSYHRQYKCMIVLKVKS